MSTAFRNQLRFVTFRLTAEEMKSLSRDDLKMGLLITWIVGLGRGLSRPDAGFLPQIGIGSVLYVFALSTLLWLLIYPMRKGEWRFEKVLTLVSLTALPGIIYGLPVELVFGIIEGGEIRLIFLILVALWRVLLLAYFLKSYGGFAPPQTGVATLLPLTAIIVVLNALNLDGVVFEAMSNRTVRPTVYDDTYNFLFFLFIVSAVFFVPLALMYLYLVARACTERSVKRYAESKNREK